MEKEGEKNGGVEGRKIVPVAAIDRGKGKKEEEESGYPFLSLTNLSQSLISAGVGARGAPGAPGGRSKP
jgi:hypothetical protein